MTVRQILVCDMDHDEDVLAQQHVLLQFPLTRMEVEADLCEDCMDLPVRHLLESKMARKMRKQPVSANGAAQNGAAETTCDFCEWRGTNNNLGRHVREEHPDAAAFACPDCSARLMSAGGLATHLARSHGIGKDNRKPRHEKALAGV